MLPFDLLSSAAEQFTFSVLCDPVDTHLFSIKHPITSIRSPWVLEQNVSFSFFVYCLNSEHIVLVTYFVGKVN